MRFVLNFLFLSFDLQVEFLLVEYFGGTCVEIDEETAGTERIDGDGGWSEPEALKTVTSGVGMSNVQGYSNWC
jgi:hypothetical protein